MTNRFDNIKNSDLRTWNRCSVLFNLAKDRSSKAAAEYAKGFSLEERNEISSMFERIKKDGYERTRAAINRGIQGGLSTLVA